MFSPSYNVEGDLSQHIAHTAHSVTFGPQHSVAAGRPPFAIRDGNVMLVGIYGSRKGNGGRTPLDKEIAKGHLGTLFARYPITVVHRDNFA